MDNLDLLDLVQPEEGYFCILGINQAGFVRQQLVQTRDEFNQLAQTFVKDERNVFFGVAKYATDVNRKKENVQSLKCMWLDIDCGPSKTKLNKSTGRPEGYIDQATGLIALREFCNTVKLPQPTLVNSGRGIHAYWPFTESISRTEWEPLGERLKQLCVEHKLYVDGSVFEVSRVLRVPGTYNFKDDPPKSVEIISTSAPKAFKEYCVILQVPETTPTQAGPKRELTPLAKSLMGNIESNFGTIMVKSASGVGCAQILDCYEQRASLPEPRWFDALSVAKFCSDKDTAIQKLSEGYPKYNPAAVEYKIEHIVGPHRCDEFEKNNPGGCDGCPHRDKIGSPITLGKIIAKAAPKQEASDDATEEPALKLPECPWPYIRGANGGIYIEGDAEQGIEPKLVYEHDLYILDIMEDPNDGFVVVMRVHLPKDGVREFVVPNTDVSEKAALKKHLAKNGVMASEKRFVSLADFILQSFRDLQFKRKAKQMRKQFGWADNNRVFIVGDREVTSNGTYHSPPSSATKHLAKHMQPVGSLDKWKEVWALYGREGLETQAFAALTAFGAPLLRFTEQSGALINLIHPESGTGKTTILRMINSVFGDPKLLLGTARDTEVGRILKLGVLNNIANTMDELTNMSAAGVSDFIYAASQGKGKDKGRADRNELVINDVTWQTLTVISSNASFYERLGSHKNTPGGELGRLLEFKIDYTDQKIISTQEGKDLFDHQLNNNFGMAGDIYIEYLINNLEDVIQLILRVQRKIDRELRLTQRERNWSAIMAVNIAGGLVAEEIGLLVDWDMTRIYKTVCPQLLDMREEVEAPASTASSIVGDFIYRYNHCLLVVDDGVDKRSNVQKFPLLEPRGPLVMRSEPDTMKFFIKVKEFKDDCVEQQINYKDSIKKLKNNGTLLGVVANKRLGKGSKIIAPGTRCLMFDASHPDFAVDVDSVVKAAQQDKGQESEGGGD